jgi:hypothetical protein
MMKDVFTMERGRPARKEKPRSGRDARAPMSFTLTYAGYNPLFSSDHHEHPHEKENRMDESFCRLTRLFSRHCRATLSRKRERGQQAAALRLERFSQLWIAPGKFCFALSQSIA